ncbi:hypothetical protein D3C83_97950 [compost metagenome]
MSSMSSRTEESFSARRMARVMSLITADDFECPARRVNFSMRSASVTGSAGMPCGSSTKLVRRSPFASVNSMREP